jgi:signal transduction histidine kinase
MTAHTPPGRRTTERPPVRPALLALLISVTATGLAWLVAMYAAPESFEAPLAWGAGAAAVALCAAVVTAVYAVGRGRRLRARIRAMERDAAHLADETAPALVRRLREGQSVESALAATGFAAGSADEGPRHRLLRTLAEEVGRGEASRAGAISACANAAGRMQALATSMLADLREMEHRHADEAVLADLLHVDHRTAQAGRLADSIAVLTGARSGRRWPKPIVMESILRGAMGRIGGYQRVRLHNAVGVAVAGHAAEGVMHALAELLDNAANFSPPTAEVHVYVEEVPAGVIITVEDSGLVMSDVALRRAERAVSREHPLDLTSLSGTRLGLAVVGCLARKHGLSVSFRPSARGGTGALMMVPHELISRPRPVDEPALPRPETLGAAAPVATAEHSAAPAAAETATVPAVATATAVAEAPGAAEATGGLPEFSASGLPKRRRGRTLAAAHPQGVPTATRRESAAPAGPATASGPDTGETRSLLDSAERFRAFRRAVRGEDPHSDAPAAPATAPQEDDAK